MVNILLMLTVHDDDKYMVMVFNNEFHEHVAPSNNWLVAKSNILSHDNINGFIAVTFKLICISKYELIKIALMMPGNVCKWC